MSQTQSLLTQSDELEIIEAIRMAEQDTSGEIRIHIEKTTALAPFDRALEVFQLLKMDETALKNGVLIYLATEDQSFVVCGDKGINDLVSDTFWDSTKEVMAAHFKQGNFKQGLIDGILRAGKELQKYFPCTDDDRDELSNEISRGE